MPSDEKLIEFEFRIDKLESTIEKMEKSQIKDTTEMMSVLKNIERCLMGNLDGKPGLMEEVREIKKVVGDRGSVIAKLTEDVQELKDKQTETKHWLDKYKWAAGIVLAALGWIAGKAIEFLPMLFQ